MNMKMKRILCAVLAAIMMLAMFVACADTPDPIKPDDDPGKDDPKNPEEDDNPYNIPDDLPEKKYPEETTFTIAYYGEKFGSFFYMEDYPGDIIGNAIFNSITAVEQRFGVDVRGMNLDGGSEYDYTDAIKNAVTTGDNEFDVAHMHDTLSANASLEGYWLNLYDVEHIDFERPWWPTIGVKAMTVQGKLYLGSSAMSHAGLGGSKVAFFNKDILKNNNFEYPYAKAFAGEWYLEDMLDMAEDYYDDLNNNDERDPEDAYGVLIGPQFYFIMESFGIQSVVNNGDALELGIDDRIYDLVDNMYGLFIDHPGGYMAVKEHDEAPVFAAGNSMFVICSMNEAINTYRASDVDYGIVPVPKLDQSQEDYYACTSDRFFVIPNTCPDTEFVGLMLEGLSAQGYRTIYPAYFESALKDRYSHDDETAQALDLVRAHMVMSFAYTYTGADCYARTLYQLITQKGSKDFASYFREGENKANNKLIDLQEKFSNLD